MEYEAKKEAVISEILQLQDGLNSSDKFTAALLWRYKLEALEQIRNTTKMENLNREQYLKEVKAEMLLIVKTMKAYTITRNGKTFYAVHAFWPARYLKSWALLDNEALKSDSNTLYFKTKIALIKHVENNF
jgi:hypothetical protein